MGCAVSSFLDKGVVHRTHRLPEGPQQTLAKTFNQGGRSAEELAAEGVSLAHTSMPNHFKAAMPAGTAMFFDTSIWHTGMPVSAAALFASSFEEAQESGCTEHIRARSPRRHHGLA